MKRFISLLLICLITSPAYAQYNCYRTTSMRSAYYPTYYSYPAATYYPPAAPAKSYYDVTPVIVVGVPVTNLGLPYYYSVGDELREERIAERTAKFIMQGGQVADQRIRETGKAPPGPGINPSSFPANPGMSETDFSMLANTIQYQPEVGNVPPVPAKPGVGYDVNTFSDLDTKVQKIFETSCITCHKPGVNKPGVQLFTKESKLYKNPNLDNEFKRRERIYDSVFGGDGVELMPKNGKPLGDQQVETIRQWKREVSVLVNREK